MGRSPGTRHHAAKTSLKQDWTLLRCFCVFSVSIRIHRRGCSMGNEDGFRGWPGSPTASRSASPANAPPANSHCSSAPSTLAHARIIIRSPVRRNNVTAIRPSASLQRPTSRSCDPEIPPPTPTHPPAKPWPWCEHRDRDGAPVARVV